MNKVVALVFMGLGLGWFRYFRIGNAVYASDNFDSDLRSDTGLLVSVVFVLIFVTLLTLLFVPTPVSSFQNFLLVGDWPTFQFSHSNFKYILIGVLCGEVFRWLHILEDEDINTDPSDSFREFIHRLRPRIFAKNNFHHDFSPDVRAGIEICCWAYGADPDLKLRLLMSVDRDFEIGRAARDGVLSEMDRYLGRKSKFPRSVKALNRYFGKGSDDNRDFLQKVAQVGKRCGYSILEIDRKLRPLGRALGLPQMTFNEVLSRANYVRSEHNAANHEMRYQQDRYWKEPDRKFMSGVPQYSSGNSVMSERDQYLRILGLPPSASEPHIHAAYQHLASVNHPDQIPYNPAHTVNQAHAAQKMAQINMAYRWLISRG